MSTLTAEPKVRVAEPWMQSAKAAADDDNDNRYRVIHYGDEWDADDFEDDLADDPEFLAELERQSARIEAERAAGTLVTYTTEEVFAMLDKNFPQLREFDDE